MTRTQTERIDDLFQQKNSHQKRQLLKECPAKVWTLKKLNPYFRRQQPLCWQLISQETSLIKNSWENTILTSGYKVGFGRIGLRKVFEHIIGWYQRLNLKGCIFRFMEECPSIMTLALLQSPMYYLHESIRTLICTYSAFIVHSLLVNSCCLWAWITSRDRLSHSPHLAVALLLKQLDCGLWSLCCFMQCL